MPSTFVLPAELTIFTVTALRPQWLSWLDSAQPAAAGAAAAGAPLVVAAAAVDEVDAAGLQLLVSLQHSLAARQRTLQLVDPSAALAGACSALGVAGLLGPVVVAVADAETLQ